MLYIIRNTDSCATVEFRYDGFVVGNFLHIYTEICNITTYYFRMLSQRNRSHTCSSNLRVYFRIHLRFDMDFARRKNLLLHREKNKETNK